MANKSKRNRWKRELTWKSEAGTRRKKIVLHRSHMVAASIPATVELFVTKEDRMRKRKKIGCTMENWWKWCKARIKWNISNEREKEKGKRKEEKERR